MTTTQIEAPDPLSLSQVATHLGYAQGVLEGMRLDPKLTPEARQSIERALRGLESIRLSVRLGAVCGDIRKSPDDVLEDIKPGT